MVCPRSKCHEDGLQRRSPMLWTEDGRVAKTVAGGLGKAWRYCMESVERRAGHSGLFCRGVFGGTRVDVMYRWVVTWCT